MVKKKTKENINKKNIKKYYWVNQGRTWKA